MDPRYVIAIAAVVIDGVSVADAARRAGVSRETARDAVRRYENAAPAAQLRYLDALRAVTSGRRWKRGEPSPLA